MDLTQAVNRNVPVQAEVEVIWKCSLHGYALQPGHGMHRGWLQNLYSSLLGLSSCVIVPWRFVSIIAEIKSLVNCNYNRPISFDWVPRVANRAAHILAHWSWLNSIFGFFGPSSAPLNLLDVILEDVGVVSQLSS